MRGSFRFAQDDNKEVGAAGGTPQSRMAVSIEETSLRPVGRGQVVGLVSAGVA